jgi:hypothetical protein
MKFQGRTRLIVLLGLVLAITTQLISVQSSIANDRLEATTSNDINTYLPFTVNNYPWVTSFGAQVRDFGNPDVINYAQQSGLNWVRIDAFDWSKIEPQNTNPSGYNWSVVDEASLKTASEYGMNVIAIIRNAPSWAQKNPPYICGPILESALPDFAEFVREVVKRYSAPPFNIKFWELGNEPDVVRAPELGFNPVFGCWGDASQHNFGGEYYGEMLNHAYPAIKSADPKAKVGIGGLLLDCDPTFDQNCQAGNFFRGILRNGIGGVRGSNFDFISFHGYTPYSGTGGGLQLDENDPKWAHRGGLVLGKVDFLHYVMGLFGVNKPIFHTEGALLCPEYDTTNCNPPNSQFFESQADYVVWLFVRNWAENVEATIWYEFQGPGWRYGGLLDGTQTPKPAFDALKFLTQELNSASYSGLVLQNTNVDGYEFITNVMKIWVLWSPDENPHTVILPSNASKAFDKYGNPLTISGNQISVKSPVYVEFPR